MSLLATILAVSEHVAEAGAEHAEHDETPFFLIGGTLAAFAILVSVIGFKKPDFPGNGAAARGIMALGVGLVLATMASVIYVSN